jgi:hypothetical protein
MRWWLLLVCPTICLADVSIPTRETKDAWKKACFERLEQSRRDAAQLDAVFSPPGTPQNWSGKRDIALRNSGIDGPLRWLAVVVEEKDLPAPKPSSTEWIGNYLADEGGTPALTELSFLDANNMVRRLGELAPTSPEVGLFRYERRRGRWVAVLQAAGMSQSTLRAYLAHFRAGLEDCLAMPPP